MTIPCCTEQLPCGTVSLGDAWAAGKHSTAQHSTAQHSTGQHSTAWGSIMWACEHVRMWGGRNGQDTIPQCPLVRLAQDNQLSPSHLRKPLIGLLSPAHSSATCPSQTNADHCQQCEVPSACCPGRHALLSPAHSKQKGWRQASLTPCFVLH